MATVQNFTVYKGEDKLLTTTMVPSVNIAGWSITFTVRLTYGSTVLITKSVGSGVAIIDPTNGVFTVQLASLDTNTGSVGVGQFFYDIQRTDAGNRTVITIGAMTVLAEVGI